MEITIALKIPVTEEMRRDRNLLKDQIVDHLDRAESKVQKIAAGEWQEVLHRMESGELTILQDGDFFGFPKREKELFGYSLC